MITDYKVGDKVWYLFRSAGDGMTHQEQVEIIVLRYERAKIKRPHRQKAVWVKIKNLRPTS